MRRCWCCCCCCWCFVCRHRQVQHVTPSMRLVIFFYSAQFFENRIKLSRGGDKLNGLMFTICSWFELLFMFHAVQSPSRASLFHSARRPLKKEFADMMGNWSLSDLPKPTACVQVKLHTLTSHQSIPTNLNAVSFGQPTRVSPVQVSICLMNLVTGPIFRRVIHRSEPHNFKAMRTISIIPVPSYWVGSRQGKLQNKFLNGNHKKMNTFRILCLRFVCTHQTKTM